jgi:hypothetical protein
MELALIGVFLFAIYSDHMRRFIHQSQGVNATAHRGEGSFIFKKNIKNLEGQP